MAAAADWLSSLPGSWGYGITQGGRVYFINEEAKSTTWLHPVTGEAVLTGHRKTPDLPTGWEEGYTFEGARYYINHNERKVTCKHPVTSQPSQDNCIFVVNDHTTSTMTSQEKKDRTVSMTSDASNCNVISTADPTSPLTRSSRTSGKVHNFGKRSNSIKRNPNAPVAMRNWLYKKANSGMKLWKKRWFVLSDLCLFYYRDEKEEGVLGSILLPSFQISLVTPEDHINRMFAFKASHPNMRTYYFCTDTSREMELWVKAMTDASLVHSEPTKKLDLLKFENPAPPEMNHVPNHRLLIRPEVINNQKNKEINKKAQEAEKYGFQKDGQDRPLTKINSVRHHPGFSDYEILAANAARYRSVHANGPDSRHMETQGHISETDAIDHQRLHILNTEPERVIQRTNSMLQLEQWIRAQREKEPDEDGRGVMSYQTLPRNMPSYRPQVLPRYPEGYRTLPRNPKPRPESLCSTAGVGYDRTVVPASVEEKRRSIRDDTMWQLYEWQQRQFYNKQTTLRRHSSLTSPKTMIHISEQTLHSIPLSPSHGSISGYHTYSPHRPYRSEVSSPVQRGDLTIDRRQKTLPNKMSQDDCRAPYKYRSEEVDVDTKLSRLCEQDKVVQALEQKLQQLHKEKYTLEQALLSASQEIEMNTENPVAIQSVVLQRDELQSGLLSTCREVSRATAELERAWRDYDKLEYDVTTARNQMRDQLDRLGEVQTESAGIQRAQMQKEIWRIQDVMEGLSKHKQQRRDIEAGNSDSAMSSSGKSPHEEKEIAPPRPPLPRSYDFSEQPPSVPPLPSDGSSFLLCHSRGPGHVPEEKTPHHVQVYHRNGSYSGPDYRLYKSEPELSTVAEVDESNGDDRIDNSLDIETSGAKGSHFPVGIVPPRTKSPPLESTTIASYVTLRKNKKLESKADRPRSAVEHLCITDSSRPRMTLEEQLERMKRHQQACLKEKRKGLNFLGSSEQSPSPSNAFSRENSLRLLQTRKREETIFSNIQDIENAVREENLQMRESPAQEIIRLKEAASTVCSKETLMVQEEDSVGLETCPEPEAKEERTEDALGQTDSEDAVQVLGGNSIEVTNHKPDNSQSKMAAANGEKEHTGILFSYEFSTDTLRRHVSLDARNLTSLPEPPTLAAPPAQPQLTEGSHFMCV
ncbi:pleckstrin homology domain-containing family A member 5 isoform X5 [Pelobates fuscus]|uniref:pleckstrin homology domain-containing family A member 5 isoform X5 n=1 Tax=Pelobates fuscus TaxID=191477 RepID=UPI002FE436F6